LLTFLFRGEDMSLIYGLGINDGKYPTKVGGKELKEYALWVKMLQRCTNSLWKIQPTYSECTISENFKNYSYFYEWCQSQVGFKNKDEHDRYWHLDKDLLIKGNKVYSESTCIFVPQRLNSLLTSCNVTRGDTPIGVARQKRGLAFRARCSNSKGKDICLGSFDNIDSAFLAYKTFKEALIKEVANEYKEQMDSRAYLALMSYRVEITD